MYLNLENVYNDISLACILMLMERRKDLTGKEVASLAQEIIKMIFDGVSDEEILEKSKLDETSLEKLKEDVNALKKVAYEREMLYTRIMERIISGESKHQILEAEKMEQEELDEIKAVYLEYKEIYEYIEKIAIKMIDDGQYAELGIIATKMIDDEQYTELEILNDKIEKSVSKLAIKIIGENIPVEEGILTSLVNEQFDIVNIGLHFFLKNVRPYAASCSEA